MLLFNSKLRLFLGKLRSQWSGPFNLIKVMQSEAVKIWSNSIGPFIVNRERLKNYHSDEEIFHYISWKLNEPPANSPE